MSFKKTQFYSHTHTEETWQLLKVRNPISYLISMFFKKWLADNLKAKFANRWKASHSHNTQREKKTFGVIEDSALSCNAVSSRAPLAASKLNVNASGIGHYEVSKHIMRSKMRNQFAISDKTIIVQILKHCSQVWSKEMYLVNPDLAGCFKAVFKGLKLKL